MCGVVGNSVDLGAVASRKDEEFGYVKGRCEVQDFFILLNSDREPTPYRGICFFIIDPYDEKSGNICGPCNHGHKITCRSSYSMHSNVIRMSFVCPSGLNSRQNCT